MKIYKNEEIKNYTPDKYGAIKAMHIFLNRMKTPYATLAFAFGGVVTVPWNVVTNREKYEAGITAYTIIYDDRADYLPFTDHIVKY